MGKFNLKDYSIAGRLPAPTKAVLLKNAAWASDGYHYYLLVRQRETFIIYKLTREAASHICYQAKTKINALTRIQPKRVEAVYVVAKVAQ